MGETKIEWADFTHNIAWGCQRVSPACEHCYAETWAKRMGYGADGNAKPTLWGPGSERRMLSADYWRQPLKWAAKARKERDAAIKAGTPLPHRPRVFSSSMADVFEDHPQLVKPRARLFGLIRDTPELDWLLLTKRPENAQRLWSEAHYSWFNGAESLGLTWDVNVWLGTTVEDQKRANERIPHLVSVPAAVLFLSCEPLLGPLDLSTFLSNNPVDGGEQAKRRNRLSGGGERRSGDTPGRHNLEGTEKRLGPLAGGAGQPSLQESAGGEERGGILAGRDDDGPSPNLRARAQTAFGATGPRDADPQGGSCMQPAWGEEQHGDPYRSTGRRDSGQASERGAATTDRTRLRGGVSDGVEHSARGPSWIWVICGGESGHGSRPMRIDWARSLRDQCADAGVPFHFKQIGDIGFDGDRVGKKAAGRTLDGKTHDAFPEPRPLYLSDQIMREQY